MQNNKVYYLISMFTWFVINTKFTNFFLVKLFLEDGGGEGMVL
jgi:hypothetical protein